jgi:rhodanese-related sulfurtransferase
MFLFKRETADNGYQNLSIDDYKTRYFDGGAPHVLVDVRTEGEFAGGHLPGAINIPLDQIVARAKEVPTGKPVVVVCASGNRSVGGSKALVNAGYTEVYNLQGGTMRWMMRRLPLE